MVEDDDVVCARCGVSGVKLAETLHGPLCEECLADLDET